MFTDINLANIEIERLKHVLNRRENDKGYMKWAVDTHQKEIHAFETRNEFLNDYCKQLEKDVRELKTQNNMDTRK